MREDTDQKNSEYSYLLRSFRRAGIPIFSYLSDSEDNNSGLLVDHPRTKKEDTITIQKLNKSQKEEHPF